MITVLVFLMLELQFTGTRGAVSFWPLAVRDGSDVTLPCWNQECNSSIWSFTGSNVLFNGGQKKKSTSDRVSLNADCSLVINKVTAEDAGSYSCNIPGDIDRTPSSVDISLSVVVMTEQMNGDRVTLSCSVSTPETCEQDSVKWLHNSKDIDRNNSLINTLQYGCFATVSFLNLTYSNISSYDFMCAVKGFGVDNRFPFSPYSSDEETNTTTRSENRTNTVTEQKNADSSVSKCEEEKMTWIYESTVWWRFIVVAVVLAALITAVVIVNIWTKAGKKRQGDENMVFNEEDDGAVKNENVQSPDEV